MNPRRRALVLALLLLVPSVLTTGPVPGLPTHGVRADDGVVGDGPARVSVAAIDLAVGPGIRSVAAPDSPDADGRTNGPPDDPALSGIGWTLLVENTSGGTWSRVEVIAEVHGALGSRSALRAALSGFAVPPVTQRVVVRADLDTLDAGGVVRIEGRVPLDGPALSGPSSAVHPLRLQVLADGSPVGRVDTAIVRLGSPPLVPLSTSLVWPLAAPPLRDPTGDVSAALDPLTVPGGRIDTLLAALDGGRPVPIVPPGDGGPDESRRRGLAFVPAVHLLEDLTQRAADVPSVLVDQVLDGTVPSDPELIDPNDANDAEFEAALADPGAVRAAVLLRRIRSAGLALRDGPVVTVYGDADLSRLLASDPALQPLAARAVLEGERRLDALMRRPPASAVLLQAPVAPASLDLLRSTTVLLPYAAIDAPDLALDVALGDPVRALRSPTGRLLDVVVGDPYLADALGTSTRAVPGDPVLAAHEVLVRTAMVHLEAPGREGRGLLLLPPEDFDPDPRFAAGLLAGLDAAPWLTLRGPAALADVAPEPREAVVLAPEPSGPLSGRLVDSLQRTERDLERLVGATEGVATDVAVRVGGRELRAANDELMRAVSRAYAGDTDSALALLSGVRSDVTTAFGTFEVAATDVTLTDRDGIVPVTITRTGGVAMQVRVEVIGPAALSWTDGRVRDLVIAPDGSGSLEVPVRSGPTGRFPVVVRVTDPTGERVLASGTLSVRATAVAGPALGLLSVLIVTLLVVGIIRQRRRGPIVVVDRTGRPDDRSTKGG